MKYMILLLLTIIALAACTTQVVEQPAQDTTIPTQELVEQSQDNEPEPTPPVEEIVEVQEEPVVDVIEEDSTLAAWQTFSLQDVDGSTFTLADYEEPVLMETFAIWCPTCLKQQKEGAQVEGVAHVNLDIDPNENEEDVRSYRDQHGFEGRYVVAPPEFTQMLIEEFGVKISNAPSAPVVLICSDKSYQLLGSGLKSAVSLEASIAEVCA